MKKTNVIIIGVVLYILSSAASYILFLNMYAAGKSVITSAPKQIKKDKEGQLIFDDNLPKTEQCPLNGTIYSKQQRAWWEKHRPLGVMIENHKEARPQSGIGAADITYEVVAEGGITRTLNIYYCEDAGIIGPIRSARTYFLDFISEFGKNPLYAHVGGANTSGPADALGQIEDYGWAGYNDLNQFSIGFPTFWRDYERLGRNVATEHTMYSTTEKLWKVAEKRKLTNVDKEGVAWNTNFTPYKFKDDNKNKTGTQRISLSFMGKYFDYDVVWTYNKADNRYLRENGGAPHVDKNTGKQLAVKNVVVLYMNESRANDGYEGNLHMLYGTKGTGKATIFMDGRKIEGTWAKKNRTAHLRITDNEGKELLFNRGKIWFEVLATGNIITVK